MKRLIVVLSISPALLVSSLAFAQDETALVAERASITPAPAALAAPAWALAQPGEEAVRTANLQATPASPTRPAGSGTTWQALKGGLLGGALGGIVSAGLNYYILPFPGSSADNALGHGMTGFFCGLVSGFVGVLVYSRGQAAEAR